MAHKVNHLSFGDPLTFFNPLIIFGLKEENIAPLDGAEYKNAAKVNFDHYIKVLPMKFTYD